ncbi:MAG: hypothetical protein KJ011_12725 [Burkholderiaceae bacterium]|nr:hypothetical protein [Burkholderiaceae bacterium]
MRWILSSLVVANVFAFALLQDWLSPWLAGDREPRRVVQQRDPDRLRVVPLERLGSAPARPSAGQARAPARAASASPAPATVPPAQPSPDASTASPPLPEAPVEEAAVESAGDAVALAADAVCTAFGPLDEPRAHRLRAALEAAGARVEATRIEQAANYFVYVPPADTLAEAQRRLAELHRIGQDDAFLMQEGALRLGISVGLYRSQDMARALVARLESLGQTGLRIVPRGAVTIRMRLQAHWPDRGAAAAAAAIAGRFEAPARECG